MRGTGKLSPVMPNPLPVWVSEKKIVELTEGRSRFRTEDLDDLRL
jgi:hypothetical protein